MRLTLPGTLRVPSFTRYSRPAASGVPCSQISRADSASATATGASAAASTSPRDTSTSRSSTSVTASPASAAGCAPSMVTMRRIPASAPEGWTTTRWPGRTRPQVTVPE